MIAWLDQKRLSPASVLRIYLGGYFIYAGINKVIDPVGFLKAIHLYSLLPENPPYFLNGSAIILPWLEIVCGISLLVGWYVRGAAIIMTMMLCVFTPAIFLRGLAVMHEQGISFFDVEFDCGCGTGTEIIWFKLCKNFGLFTLAVMTALSRSRYFAIEGWLCKRAAASGTCSIAETSSHESTTTDAAVDPTK